MGAEAPQYLKALPAPKRFTRILEYRFFHLAEAYSDDIYLLGIQGL